MLKIILWISCTNISSCNKAISFNCGKIAIVGDNIIGVKVKNITKGKNIKTLTKFKNFTKIKTNKAF